ncbi:hypothetical protein, partial [Pseudomonas sp.]|uniref:hypothetical protein n=1 Tax=Pseudomonas sp. TaxID=306 RepID=UPI0032633DE8
MPALGAFRIHEKGEAIVVREGVVLGTGFGVSDRGLGESHRTISVSYEWRRFVRFAVRLAPRKNRSAERQIDVLENVLIEAGYECFQGGRGNSQRKTFLWAKKMDLFSEIHFLMLGAGNETR